MKNAGLAHEVRTLISDAWAVRVVQEFDRLKPLADVEHERKWGPKYTVLDADVAPGAPVRIRDELTGEVFEAVLDQPDTVLTADQSPVPCT